MAARLHNVILANIAPGFALDDRRTGWFVIVLAEQPSAEQRELFEDPALPVAPPVPDDMPPLEEETSPDSLIIPQGYAPEAQNSAPENAPPPKSTLNWSARAKRFLGEVTTFR